MEQPTLIEKFADNGEHSHWELIDTLTGELLWKQPDKSTNSANTFLPAVYSNNYLKWVKQANLPPLTNTQHRFAEWLLNKKNAKIISQIGDLDAIFTSVRKWIKNQTI